MKAAKRSTAAGQRAAQRPGVSARPATQALDPILPQPAEPGTGLVALDAGLTDLGLVLQDRQREQLIGYLGLLQRWNGVYNLTALRAREDMVSHHLMDCLAILGPLAAWCDQDATGVIDDAACLQQPAASAVVAPAGVTQHAVAVRGGDDAGGRGPGGEGGDEAMTDSSAGSARATMPAVRMNRVGSPGPASGHPVTAAPAPEPCAILDVGSGGGLPGVVLAICRPDWSVTCVDTVAKKASFVRQVAAELRLPGLTAQHARVEALAVTSARRYQVITSRAFSSLSDFVGLTGGLLAPGGVWVAMKGALPEDEIRMLPADTEMFHVEHLQVPGLDARRCLVWMRPRTGSVPIEKG